MQFLRSLLAPSPAVPVPTGSPGLEHTNTLARRNAAASVRGPECAQTPDLIHQPLPSRVSPWSRLPRELRAVILQTVVSSSEEDDWQAQGRRERARQYDGLPFLDDGWWPNTRVKSTHALYCIDGETRSMMQGLYPHVTGGFGRRIAETFITAPPEDFEFTRSFFSRSACATWSPAEETLVARTTVLGASDARLTRLYNGKVWKSMHERARLNQVLQLCAQNLAHFAGLKHFSKNADVPAMDALAENLRFPRLRELRLTHANLRDESLVGWLRAAASSLEVLELEGNDKLRFGRAVTETFFSLHSLRNLDLTLCAISDEAANALPLHLLTGLQTLNLAGNQLTGRLSIGRYDQPLLQIQVLNLNGNRSLSSLSRPMANFVGSKNLRNLSLAYTQIQLEDEEDLRALSYERMRILGLQGIASVDDAVAARLPNLFQGSLQLLYVESTRISQAALRELERALPHTEVRGEYFD